MCYNVYVRRREKEKNKENKKKFQKTLDKSEKM
jgi:hypothetical protein